jgi:hypothetical protein
MKRLINYYFFDDSYRAAVIIGAVSVAMVSICTLNLIWLLWAANR